MLHSSFDLETHARTRQADALRVADRARLAAAAVEGRVRVSRVNVVSQILATLKERLTRLLAPAYLAAPEIDDVTVPDFSMIVADSSRPVPPRRPVRAAEPYAAMVIVARSANIPLSRQPGEVREC